MKLDYLIKDSLNVVTRVRFSGFALSAMREARGMARNVGVGKGAGEGDGEGGWKDGVKEVLL